MTDRAETAVAPAMPIEEPRSPERGTPGPQPRRRTSALGRWLRQEPAGVVAALFLAAVVVVAVFAPLVAPADPLQQDIPGRLASPSAAHWLGTDDIGRDVLSRLIFGARASLWAALLAVTVAAVIGIPLGLLAGYAGRWVDAALMRITDTILSFPALVLAVGVTGALGVGLTTSMFAIGLVFAPSVARLMRGRTLTVRNEPYVEASTLAGSRSTGIIVRHILPNAVQPVLVQLSLLFAAALLAEAGLSFLGLGVQPPTPSWGAMLGRAYGYLNKAPAQMYAPGIAIALCALSFNILGDAIRRQLDPQQRR
ncbi:MAG: binding-protein-dependent transport system inner rane component [Ilumatobacteraceae bacterium]|nr:binding-protein-dependent transport system inner rane component [Ilumatobacteraceae bacterium]